MKLKIRYTIIVLLVCRLTLNAMSPCGLSDLCCDDSFIEMSCCNDQNSDSDKDIPMESSSTCCQGLFNHPAIMAVISLNELSDMLVNKELPLWTSHHAHNLASVIWKPPIRA